MKNSYINFLQQKSLWWIFILIIFSTSFISKVKINDPFYHPLESEPSHLETPFKKYQGNYVLSKDFVGPCGNMSTLDCGDIRVVLPFSLSFNGDEEGISNTGFTMVQAPSARLAVDNPVSNAAVPGLEPGKLNIASGKLQMTATKGIFYSTPLGTGSSTETNSQINALGVGLNNPASVISIVTTLDQPNFSSSAGDQSQQAGLWYGVDEDHYVKLAVIKASATQQKIQLFSEDLTNSTLSLRLPELNTVNFNTAGVSSIKLRLEIDPSTNTAKGYYSLDGGVEIQVPGNATFSNAALPISARIVTGANHDLNVGTPNLVYAGIFSTIRRALATESMDFFFQDFDILGEEDSETSSSVLEDFSYSQGNLIAASAGVWVPANSGEAQVPILTSGISPQTNNSLDFSLGTQTTDYAPIAASPISLVANEPFYFSTYFNVSSLGATATDRIRTAIKIDDGTPDDNWVRLQMAKGPSNGLLARVGLGAPASDNGSATAQFDETLQFVVRGIWDGANTITYSFSIDPKLDLSETVWSTSGTHSVGAAPSITRLFISSNGTNNAKLGPVRLSSTYEEVVTEILEEVVVDTPCSPFSLLPCDQIVKSLPVNLTFSGNDGGLVDGNNISTGFTMADPHTASRLAADGPVTFPSVNGYEPSKLNVQGGNFSIAASAGIAFINNNAQVNSLGVGLNDLSAPIVLETKLLNISTGVGSAQAGIWFGIDNDNFVKLNFNNNANIEVRKEVNGVSSTAAIASNTDQIQVVAGAPGNTITLRMVVDPGEMTITSFYAIGSGEFIQVTNSAISELALPQIFLTGKQISVNEGNATFAGIYNTYRSGAPFTSTFDYFTVEQDLEDIPKALSFNPTTINVAAIEGEEIPPFTVTLSSSVGTPPITLGDDPHALGDWLLFPDSPAVGDLQFDFVQGLSAGNYSTTITAQDSEETGYSNADLVVNLTIIPLTDLKVNFSDEATAAPQGYLKDSGSPYADRGNGYSYGWLDAATSTPANLTPNARNRAISGVSVLNNTLIHMQYGTVETPGTGFLPDAMWEMEIPNGTYTVTVGVGDPNVDGAAADNPVHTINAEGVTIINDYVASGVQGSPTRGTTGTGVVTVTDGKLTLTPTGGHNTKINFVEIVTSTEEQLIPSVLGVNPANGATNVPVTTSVSANNLYLPNPGGLNNATLTTSTVKLFKQGSTVQINASVNGTGGGDAINLVPALPLESNTTYVFEIEGVQDVSGATLQPFTSTFTTGDGGATGPSTDLDNVSFNNAGVVKSGQQYTTLEIGPDKKLYGISFNGDIFRWTINADGTLANEEVLSAWKSAYNNSRTAIGFVFDPAATADNLIAYISHVSFGVNAGAADWDGNISKLSGANLQNEQLLVTQLPRSNRDHLTNSLAFRPSEPNVIYFLQGSNSAAGAYDGAWQREESLLSGAGLRLDMSKLPSTLPLNVRTTRNIEAIKAANVNSPTLGLTDLGTPGYNPYYVNAPLTIYASGIRNAYDLVWHSNGQLYIPTNGTAGGSNAPASIDGMRRPDGTFYNTSGNPAMYPPIPASNNNNTQRDWLFRINPSETLGYFGHPNPYRGEFVLNRGDVDVDNAVYNGIQPDVNYRGYAFDFEFNKSPNGVIEYKSNAENGNLQGALLVVRYSGGSDIIALVPDGPNGDVETFKIGIPGFAGFTDPLDLIEDVATGNIYVSDYATRQIILLKPSNEASPRPVIALSTNKFVGDAVTSGDNIYSEEVVISNLGNAVLTDIQTSITGANANQFSISALPQTVNVQNSGSFSITFNPTSNGPKTALLTISSFNADPVTITLSGLGKAGLGGGNEPSLQWVLDSHLGAGVIDVGDVDPATNILTTGASTNYNSLIGDELDIQEFQAASDGPVSVEVLSVYGPTDSNPVVAFGYYQTGNAGSVQELFTVSNSPASNGQTLNPVISGSLSFDPGNDSFGFVSRWPYFGNRQLFSEDALNTFSGAIPHHVRVYALPGEANAYVIATEEHVSGFDYQDIVVIVRNIKPFGATNPEEACSPISTLDCDQLAVSLPFNLNFSGTEGGMANTGFTMVDNPSARITADGPTSNPSVPGFEPSRLSFSNGNLLINAANGIAFARNGTGTGFSTDVNSQINTLGAGIDADAYGNFSISTTIVNPYTDGSGNSEQAGIWFGLNEDNFVKLVTANPGTVQMIREINGLAPNTAANDVQLTGVAGLHTSMVTLRLYVDVENNTLTGFYSLNGGAEVTLGTLELPTVYRNGNSSYSNLSFAGIFATKRREATATVVYTFSDFSIIPDHEPVIPTFGPLNINFSTPADATPAGYEKDSGSPYGNRGNGYTYGWMNTNGVTPLDLTANTRNRNVAGADFIQNTIIHMQYQNGVPPGGTPNGVMVEGIWEVAVPNGTYSVTVGAGDLNVDGDPLTNPRHNVNAEGVNVINQFVPTGAVGAPTRVTSGSATVTVTDGKLTIDATGGFNTKLYSLTVTQITPGEEEVSLVADPDGLIFEIEVQNSSAGPGRKTDTHPVTITNDSEESIEIIGISFRGGAANDFSATGTTAIVLAPGQSTTYNVTYAPALNNTNLGYHAAELVLNLANAEASEFAVGLYALKKNGFEGGNEPPLQAVVNTLGIGINVGWTSLADGVQPVLKGEEVLVQQWIKAGPGQINITPVGRYSPAEALPFGWYTNGSSIVRNQVGVLAADIFNAQTLFPEIAEGDDFFDPGSAVFGIYVTSNSFQRSNYTEDALNLTSGGTGGVVARRVRTYPMKDRAGNLIENSYLVNFEDASNGDYQDYMFILDNVIPYEDGALKLEFEADNINVSAAVTDGNSITQQVTLNATGGLDASEVTLSSAASWITFPEEFELGVPFDLIINTSGLSQSEYLGVINASSPGYTSDQMQINLTLTGTEPVFTYQFNFQLPTNIAPSPAGWINDLGAPYASQTTTQGAVNFGWVIPGTTTPASAVENARNRNTASSNDALLNTLTIMGHRTVATYPLRDWVVNLPNGSYNVNISVGDITANDSYHNLDVNGVNVINYNQETAGASAPVHFQDTKTVVVSDGILRLSLATGGVNAKVNYIRIAPIQTGKQPPLIEATLDGVMFSEDVYRGPVSISALASDLSGSAEGIVRFQYSVNGQALQDYTAPISLSQIGSYIVLLEAEDGNGNKAVKSYQLTVEEPTGAMLFIENMNKIPGTNRGFPANDYYTFHRLRNPGAALVHDKNVLRINNTGTGELVVSDIIISDLNDFEYEILTAGGALPRTIAPGGFIDLDITFKGDHGGNGHMLFKESIMVVSNADNGSENTAVLHGAFSPVPEGGVEIDSDDLFNVFGFQSKMNSIVNDQGTITPPNTITYRPSSNFPIPENVDAGYEGDLILSGNFVQADPSKPVYGFQISALHGPGSNGARFVQVGGTGTVGGMNFSHAAAYYQTLFPKNGSGVINNDMAASITVPFRIAIADYLSSGGNNINGARPDLLGIRVYKVIDHNGDIIPNEYIVLQDFIQNGCGAGSANCDWNDNTFYFTNIRPEAVPTAQAIDALAVNEGEIFSEDITSSFDKGYPGNKLTYTATLVGGGAIPSWMTMGANGILSGTADATALASYQVDITATDLNGLTTSSLVQINVNKAPTAVVNADVTEGRLPLTVQFTGDNSSDNSAIVEYAWDFGGVGTSSVANPIFIFNEAGDYNVVLSVTGDTGLIGKDSVTITVVENFGPLTVATADITNGIAPLTVAFDGSTSTSDGEIVDYLWDFGNGDTSSEVSPSYTFTSPGQFAVTLTVTDDNGLSDDAVLNITVAENLPPVAIGTANVQTGTVPLTVLFDGESSTDEIGIVSYEWNFGDGSPASELANPTHTYTTTGTFTATLTVEDASGLSASATVQIVVEPEIQFSLYLNTGSSATVSFDDKVFVGDIASPTYYNSTHVYTNTSASNLTLYQTERGSMGDLLPLNYSIPVPNGTYIISTYHNELYYGKASGSPSGIVGRRVFDILIEGVLVKDNLDLFLESGNNPLKLVFEEIEVTDGVLNINMPASANRPSISGLAIEKIQVNVNEAPVAVATADKEEVLVGEAVSFVGSTSTDDKEVVGYAWDFKDGNTSDLADPTHAFTEMGTYNVELTVSDAEGLTNSTVIQITVNAPKVDPVAVASATPNPAVVGEEISFIGENSTDDGDLIYAWNFDDGTASAEMNPIHIYNEAGQYEVMLSVIDEDFNIDFTTFTVNVELPAVPEPVFSLYVNSGDTNEDVSYNGKTFKGEKGLTGLNSNSNSTYLNTGLGAGQLFERGKASVGNPGTLVYEIDVPVGVYKVTTYHIEQMYGVSQPGILGSRLFDITIEGEGKLSDVDLFGESGNSPLELVFDEIEVTDGKLTLELVGKKGKPLISGFSIELFAPRAEIGYTPETGITSETEVQFSGSGSRDNEGIVSYLWSFGDGATSTEMDPVHLYSEDGIYEVSLTVTDSDGFKDTDQVSIVVGEITLPAFSLYVNSGDTNEDVSYNGKTFKGEKGLTGLNSNSNSTYLNTGLGAGQLFERGKASVGNPGTLVYEIDVPVGVYKVTTYHIEQMYGVSQPGILGSRLFDITIEGEGKLSDVDLFGESGNSPLELVFDEIEVTDGKLTLELVGKKGKPLISGFSIELFAPRAEIGYTPETGITSETEVQFSGSGSRDNEGIVSYLWSFGDGATSTEMDPVHLYSEDGIYEVSLTVTDSDGFKDTDQVSIVVGEITLPAFSLYVNSGDTNEDVSYNGKTFKGEKGLTGLNSNSNSTYLNTGLGAGQLFERGKASVGNPGTLVYEIDVPVGVYKVTTYHIEQMYGVSQPGILGSRLFDITIEGEGKLSDVDLFGESGNSPLELVFDEIEVTDGKLTLELVGKKGKPLISGFSIELFAPRAEIGYTPETGITSETEVQFSGSGSRDNEGIVSYLWSFGDGATSTEMDPVHLYSEDGIYEVSLTVTDSDGFKDTDQVSIVVGEITLPAFSLYVNSGDTNEDVSYNGKTFKGEKGLTGLNSNSNSTYLNTGLGAGQLFERGKASVGNPGTLVYEIDVPVGVYKVTTYHIEQMYGVSQPGILGSRLFDITIEGEGKLSDVDLFGESGNSPLELVFDEIEVTDGKLTLELVGKKGKPLISGFSIEQSNISTEGLRILNQSPTILASPMEGDGPLKVDFMGDLTGVDQGNLSYSYDFGDGSVSTDKNASHVFMAPGTHEVKVTVSDGKELVTEETISIQVNRSNELGFNTDSGFGQTSIKMYPNPASSVVNLQPTDSSIQIGEIAIFDIRGRLIQRYEPNLLQNGNKLSIRIDNLAAGIYLVTTTTESGVTQMHRLIVE
ncbi:PKD domain-containing protein [Algoriphagus sp. NG3]|uniref:PKD domain-containing protein n=1 Tax=Algoriphagus sp. NG3 TaxID=3097546 RepID=UPI002A826846|nr:PKD domain-containing protein [Algoriphagus sp. NG3]WPR77524.1 PKD domain-containing protein [Algoriphagus sp. NG3]